MKSKIVLSNFKKIDDIENKLYDYLSDVLDKSTNKWVNDKGERNTLNAVI